MTSRVGGPNSAAQGLRPRSPGPQKRPHKPEGGSGLPVLQVADVWKETPSRSANSSWLVSLRRRAISILDPTRRNRDEREAILAI